MKNQSAILDMLGLLPPQTVLTAGQLKEILSEQEEEKKEFTQEELFNSDF